MKDENKMILVCGRYGWTVMRDSVWYDMKDWSFYQRGIFTSSAGVCILHICLKKEEHNLIIFLSQFLN